MKVILQGNQIIFFCPGCKTEHVLNTTWDFNGDVNNPTISPSIRVSNPRHGTTCHSYIKNGQIEYLGDCRHDLAGQTAELPEMNEREWIKKCESD